LLEQHSANFEVGSAVPDAEFESELQAAVVDAYPVLIQRLEKAAFADWHRRRSQESDLAHEAIVLFMRHCRRHQRLPEGVLAYLVKIAKNLAARGLRDYLRDRGAMAELAVDRATRSPSLIYVEEELTPDESPTAAREVRLERVRAEIDRLPPRQQAAIKLYIENPGMTQRQLSRMMGIGEDAFQKNLSRAIARIREALTLEQAT
jgi:RNA polymerase sigma factor (sigma-70 family)